MVETAWCVFITAMLLAGIGLAVRSEWAQPKHRAARQHRRETKRRAALERWRADRVRLAHHRQRVVSHVPTPRGDQ